MRLSKRHMVTRIGRRQFVSMLGAVATAWPVAASAQQPDRTQWIGVLMSLAANDPEGQARAVAFESGLNDLGWVKSRNVRIEYRWADNPDLLRRHASELIGLAPNLILTSSTPVIAALQEQRHTIPVVFTQVTDPVGQGLVSSLAHPGGHLTGFTTFEFSIGTKWLQTLKEVAPGVTRVALVFNPQTAPFADLFWRPVEAVAATFGVVLISAGARTFGELERMIDALGREPNGALIVLPDVSTMNYRDGVIGLAARHNLPAVYPSRVFVANGGLLSYGTDVSDVFRRAASYADRILKGAKPADLPIQAPSKYELVINLKAARSLGLELSPMLLARADEIIE
jgi:putative tryptophan/tyrosine transport system substrate-binding protein